MIRWGIIGTGGIAQAFARDLALPDGPSAVAVGSRRAASADAFGDATACRAARAYEALVADPEVDAVYVATPHPLHHRTRCPRSRPASTCSCEKPFTMDAAEARELVAAARAARGVPDGGDVDALPAAHRADPRLLADGALGEIARSPPTTASGSPPDPAHRLFAPELGGGALLDLGIYPVSFASMVLGHADRGHRARRPRLHRRRRADVGDLLGYASGAHAVLTCTLWARDPRAPRSSAPRADRDRRALLRADVVHASRAGGEPERFDELARRGQGPALRGRRGRAVRARGAERRARGCRSTRPCRSCGRWTRSATAAAARLVPELLLLTTLPIALRGSASTKRTSRGRLWGRAAGDVVDQLVAAGGSPSGDDPGDDALAQVVVGLAGDRGLARRRMLEQGALDLARADLVAAALDQVGRAAADDAHVAVGRAGGEVAGEEPAVARTPPRSRPGG